MLKVEDSGKSAKTVHWFWINPSLSIKNEDDKPADWLTISTTKLGGKVAPCTNSDSYMPIWASVLEDPRQTSDGPLDKRTPKLSTDTH